MAIDYQERIDAWNILITTGPPFYQIRAGAYQSRTQPFLTWKDFFADLLLCFDLESVLTSGQLALWFRSADAALANEAVTPCVYYPESDSYRPNFLDKFIKITSGPPDNDRDELGTKLHLTLVAHDHESCIVPESALDEHMKKGIMNPKIILN
jgi:hypothetical protein